MIRLVQNCSIIGLQKSQFQSASGEPVYGYNVYFSFEPDGIEGVAAGRCYVSAKPFKQLGLGLGSVISVAFNATEKKYELVA